MKVLLKISAGLLVVAVVLCVILYAIYNQPLPSGRQGPETDVLAIKMLEAINYKAYKDTRYLEWSFRKGTHHYKWDKENGTVQVEWDDYRVLLNLNRPEKSSIFESDEKVAENSRAKLIEKAVSYFNNDSFWLVAPFKIFDSGTERSLVQMEDGSEGILVTYTVGGTTPGDSYLWKLGPNAFPESFRMWVEIIPIGGLEATWDDWKIMESGVFLPTTHRLGPIDFPIEDLRAYK